MDEGAQTATARDNIHDVGWQPYLFLFLDDR